MKFVELSVEELTEAVALFEKFHSFFSDCFRTKTRDVSQQSSQYIQGQLLCRERGNMTNLTRVVPESNPQSFQQFLSDSPWKDEGAIEKFQQQVTKLIGDAQESALHIDETGFLKQGAHSVGVKRQYCGRLGKVDNCQVGVFLGYTCGNHRILIDRRLYLPEDWAQNPERRQKAGVPEEVTFQTKAQLGLEMVKEAMKRGLPFGWIGMDCHYGEQPWLLAELSELSVIYAADVPCDTRVWLSCPQTEIPARKGTRGRRPRKRKVKGGEERPSNACDLSRRHSTLRYSRLLNNCLKMLGTVYSCETPSESNYGVALQHYGSIPSGMGFLDHNTGC